MAADCLFVPPLPLLDLWRPKPGRAGASPRPPVFPKALENELTRIARDAVRAGVDPVIAAPADASEAQARVLLDRSFRAFLKERSRVWPPVLRHVKEKWLVLFPLLREVSSLIRMERMKLPVPAVDDDSPGSRSLMRLGLALRTYALTLELTLGSIPQVVSALAAGKAPKEIADPGRLLVLLGRIDVATAALEFGTIAAVRLLERRGNPGTHVFARVAEFAARGADEQHVILRGVLRKVVGEERGPDRSDIAEPASSDEVPPETLLADWVRAVLAA